jgi:hypothetical protein
MVVCANKQGQPGITVDFKAPNTHASRESHRNQSSFQLPLFVIHGNKKID